jgi:hypothetical protein
MPGKYLPVIRHQRQHIKAAERYSYNNQKTGQKQYQKADYSDLQ